MRCFAMAKSLLQQSGAPNHRYCICCGVLLIHQSKATQSLKSIITESVKKALHCCIIIQCISMLLYITHASSGYFMKNAYIWRERQRQGQTQTHRERETVSHYELCIQDLWFCIPDVLHHFFGRWSGCHCLHCIIENPGLLRRCRWAYRSAQVASPQGPRLTTVLFLIGSDDY